MNTCAQTHNASMADSLALNHFYKHTETKLHIIQNYKHKSGVAQMSFNKVNSHNNNYNPF